MGGYAVDMAELQRVDVVLCECSAQARAALVALTSSAHELFSGGWASPAASAFRLGWQEWADGAHAALTALEELGSAVGVAGVGYDSTDTAVCTVVAGAAA